MINNHNGIADNLFESWHLLQHKTNCILFAFCINWCFIANLVK